MTRGDDLARVRALALGAVALVVAAAGAVDGDGRVIVLLGVAAACAGVAAWRHRRAGRTGLGTSASVAAVLVLLLLVERVTRDVDVVLGVTAAVSLAAAVALRERRLAVSGLASLAALLGRPGVGADTFSHCLVAPDLAVPLPRLDGPLLLAVGAVAVGSALRWSGLGDRWRRASVARGVEVSGAVGLLVLLLAKAAELPGHRLLCGAGDAVDEGWLVLTVAYGAIAGLYGLAARDVVWEGVGLVAVTGAGVLATALSGDWWWAAGCAILLVGSLAVAEHLQVPWPDRPGYTKALPRPADLRARFHRRGGPA